MTLFWSFYCKLRTYLTPFSSVSIFDFEQVNVNWELSKFCNTKYKMSVYRHMKIKYFPYWDIRRRVNFWWKKCLWNLYWLFLSSSIFCKVCCFWNFLSISFLVSISRDLRQILLLILSDFKSITFYFLRDHDDFRGNRSLINLLKFSYFFHDCGPYHIETSPLICPTNQWPDFYMIGPSVMKELILEAKSANNYLSENIRKTHKWIAIS